ncbi:aldehyde dehydrogenase [Mediterraneibacter sp. ICN-202921]|uniref:aldehyde dehydrogenase n=1 Tax=Mediterraneibacter sp. ICN-202921 TaxID=3134657 RepID=UPI0030BA7F85
MGTEKEKYTQIDRAQIEKIMCRQKQFFQTGKTLDVHFRAKNLQKLYQAIQMERKTIERALFLDLGKHRAEAYETEIGLVLSDIRYTLKHLSYWTREEKVHTPVHLFPGKSRVRKEPYGQVLIMGPYNYPFQLLIEPLIGAVAAGNCAVLKPSELAPHTAAAVKEMVEKTFEERYICCVCGGIEANQALLAHRFDYLFFTGSVRVGKLVMQAAAEHLTPVTLELGGKSPVIVEKSANIKQAAYRIMWGKLLNAGQTCVAPDYVLADESVKEELLEELKTAVVKLYGTNVQSNTEFGRIVNENHFDRLSRILKQDEAYQVFFCGRDRQERYIGPVILDLQDLGENEQAACMQEELFGPILPVLSYKTLKEAVHFVQKRETPLALYIFTRNSKVADWILQHTRSGGAAVNDTISHLVGPYLPFGGVGNSGIGKYHGKYSFSSFTHERSVYRKPAGIQLSVGYPPYKKWKERLVRSILK